MTTRRDTLVGGAALAASTVLPAAATAQVQRYPDDPREVVRLWPRGAPGAPARPPQLRIVERGSAAARDRYADSIGDPVIEVFRPARANGSALLVMPGGGYVRVVLDKEGYELARRLNAEGVTVFVLRYRLPGEGWLQRADAPLQDAQRALRLIRQGATGYAVDPARIGVMGFSAGGHLAASLATRHAAQVYPAVDAADGLSARPDFAALIYPVIDLTGEVAHSGSRDTLLGPSSTSELRAAYSPQRTVDAQTPATWLLHAADDASVPVENSLLMLSALRQAKIPAELHVFEEGGHGFGLKRAEGKPVANWPGLFLAWARRHRFIPA